MTTYTEDDLRQALAGEASATPPPVDVWPQLRRRVAVRTRVRAGVAAGVAAVAVTAAIVTFPTGNDTVRLPAAHGHATTLLPTHSLTDAELATSAGVLRQRLDSLGVNGATIATNDGGLDVSAPGLSPTQIEAIAAPGVLQFRPVTAIAPGTSCPSPGSGDVACTTDGTVQYTLGPVALDNADVKSADAVQNTVDNSWLVELTFDSAGAAKFRTLTADAANKPFAGGSCGPPQGCNAIAIVADGTVVSAPSVEQPGGIPGGQTQITGAMTQRQARLLAAFASTHPLPASFSIG